MIKQILKATFEMNKENWKNHGRDTNNAAINLF